MNKIIHKFISKSGLSVNLLCEVKSIGAYTTYGKVVLPNGLNQVPRVTKNNAIYVIHNREKWFLSNTINL
jgi:hypothetical protein